MNSGIKNKLNTAESHHSISRRAVNIREILLMTSVIFAAFISMGVSAGSFQHNALFNPGKFQLQAEKKGRIMIYDQMDSETVEMALNEQFDRIGSMMFVRTQYIQQDGSIEEDNDCD